MTEERCSEIEARVQALVDKARGEWPGELRREGPCGRICLTDGQREWVRRWWPLLPDQLFAELLGVAQSTAHRLRRSVGAVKTAEGRPLIAAWQCARAWRTNSLPGGFYDQQRANPDRDGLDKARGVYLEMLRRGERRPGFVLFRERDPEGYAETVRRRAENRKKTLRSERRRLIWGEATRTRLAVRLRNYTRRQIAHRHDALKRGYWFYEDCSDQGGERYNIYWDEHTRRGERFERNLALDGFTVKDGRGIE